MNEPGGFMNSSIQQLPYPVGITVLNLCHTDPHHSIDSMLAQCRYNVKTTTQAMTALELLQDAKSTIDLVIIDMDEHGMDGLRLLTSVVLRKNMPVIALTTNSLGGLFMEGYKYGLCELLLKPVGIKKLENIWKHVIVRRENKLNSTCTESSEDSQESKGTESFEDSQEFKGTESSEAPKEFKGTETSEAPQEVKENVGHTRKAYKRRGEYNNEINKCEQLKGLNEEDNRPNKRPRVVWTEELHCKFIAAVDMLGIDKAVPKRILELMNDGSLTRENVASHLQKYRLLLKKSSDQTKKAIPLGVGSTHDMQPFSGVSVGNLEPTYFRTPLSGIDDTNSMACNGYISHPTTSFMSESAEATEGLQVESHLNITDDINSSLGPEIQEHVDYAKSLVGEGYFDRNFSGMALNAPGNFSQIMQGEHVSIESSPVTFLPEYLLTNSNPGTSSPLGFSYNRGDVGVFNGESTLIINSRESSHGSHTYLQTHDFNDMSGNVNVLASNWGDYPSNTCNSNTSDMDHPFIHHGLGSASAFPFTNDASENFDLKTELNGSYLNDAELRASLGFVNQIQATQPTWKPHTSDATQEPHANIQYTRQSW